MIADSILPPWLIRSTGTCFDYGGLAAVVMYILINLQQQQQTIATTNDIDNSNCELRTARSLFSLEMCVPLLTEVTAH